MSPGRRSSSVVKEGDGTSSRPSTSSSPTGRRGSVTKKTAADGGGDGASGSEGPVKKPGSSSGTKTKKKEKEEDPVKRVERRMEESATGMGLRDWCWNASLLVKDCVDMLEPECPMLEMMLESIYGAALGLNNENWRRFGELVFDRIHCQDHEVHGALFAKIEPTWRQLLYTPRGGQTSVFLHIGTEPPSTPLMSLLTKLGWFGVVISPIAPEPGNEDLIQHVNLDPGHDKDRDEFVALGSKSGGQLPKPSQFMLAFVNCVFGPNDPDPDPDEELGLTTRSGKNDEEDGDLDNFGEDDDDRRDLGQTNSSGVALAPSWERAKWVTQEMVQKREEKSKQCSTASGYGKLGVTRYPDVRKRLRALNTSLAVALQRLKPGGTLVMLWPGIPCHPVMFFLTASLRPLFARVHVVANDGIKTFESYIVCANFYRDKAMEATPGEGGSALRSFFSCAYRRPALDDVLLWTLTSKEEVTEALFGVGGSSKSKTYDELWNLYAKKYKALAADLDLDVTKVKAERQKKQKNPDKEDKLFKGKEDKTPKGKGDKAAPKDKAATKAKAKAKGKGKPESSESTPPAKVVAAPTSGGAAPVEASPKRAASPEKAVRAESPPKEDEKAKTPEAAPEAAAAAVEPASPTFGEESPDGLAPTMNIFDALAAAAADEAAAKKVKKPKPFQLSRSVPTLSCTLGAVQGSLCLSKGEPDRFKLAEAYPMIRFGQMVAENKIDVRKFYRKREDVGVNLAGDGVTSPVPDSMKVSPSVVEEKRKIPNWNGPGIPYNTGSNLSGA